MYFLSIKCERHCWKTACLILSLLLKRGPEVDWGRGGRGGGGAQYFVSTDSILNRLVRAFSLTWPVARQTYYSKRRRKQETRGLHAYLLLLCPLRGLLSWGALPKVFDYLTCLHTWRALLTWAAVVTWTALLFWGEIKLIVPAMQL